MPSIQTIDLNPLPRTEATSLEKTLSGFAKQHRANQVDQQDTDALADIYKQHQADGDNIGETIKSIQTRSGMSPTARVNSIKQLLEFQDHNVKLQNEANKKLQIQAKSEAATNKATEAKNKEEQKIRENQAIIADIEQRRGLEKGSLAAYVSNPAMAQSITKPETKNQANKPIDPDQLKRIQHVESLPGFEAASISEKKKWLRNNGVSKENIDSITEGFVEDNKLENKRDELITAEQAKADFNFANEQTEKIPQLTNRGKTLDDAAVLNEEGVTGKSWDQAMQMAGLLQFTSEGYREFASYAKEMVKNQNIKSIIGAQISQMEFGFFRDATISERFSKEANRQIIKKERAALRYEKLYADITRSLVEQNGGKTPKDLQAKVNTLFAEQSKKISKEVKEAAIDFKAIQEVPKGKVLMFDKKRRPLHIPANEVEKYSKPPYGATLS